MVGAAILQLAGYAAVAAGAWIAIALGLAPIGGGIGALPGPDLLFCVAVVVAVRRPLLAPPPLVFALGLARDMLGGGAVGLGALTLTLSAAALRAQAEGLRGCGFLVEWGAAALGAAAALFLQWLALTATLAPAPPLTALAGGWLATALAYPVCALLLRRPMRGALSARPA